MIPAHCKTPKFIQVTITQKLYMSLDRFRVFQEALIAAVAASQIDVALWGKLGYTDERYNQIERDKMGGRETIA